MDAGRMEATAEQTLPQYPEHFRRIFEPHEDKELLRLYDLYKGDWRVIAKHMVGRTPKQCKDRYRNYLSPDLVDSEWTVEEDRRLLELAMKYTNKWNQISYFFKGRSPNSLKNRYHKHLKRRQLFPFDEVWTNQHVGQRKARLSMPPQSRELSEGFDSPLSPELFDMDINDDDSLIDPFSF